MLLSELLDSEAEWKWLKQNNDVWKAAFKVDGREFELAIHAWPDIFSDPKNENNRWDFEFVDRTDDVGKAFGNTGKMDRSAITVFATVMKIVREFIEEKRPNRISFTGNKAKKRDKLYLTLIRAIGNDIKKLGYKIEHRPDDLEKNGFMAADVFTLVREGHLDEGVKELITALIIGAAAIGGVDNVEAAKKKPVAAKTKIVKLIPDQKRLQKLSAAAAQKYQKADPKMIVKIVKLAKKHEDPVFPRAEDILATIGVESSFNPKAKSNLPKDPAIGLMQVRPEIWGISPSELSDVESQIKHGVVILKKKYNRFKGDKIKTIHAYNVGITGVLQGRRNENYVQKWNRERELYT